MEKAGAKQGKLWTAAGRDAMIKTKERQEKKRRVLWEVILTREMKAFARQ